MLLLIDWEGYNMTLTEAEFLSTVETTTVEIVFEKNDGTMRTMLCTRDASKIPADHAPKGAGRELPEGLVPVYDLEAEGWRSVWVNRIQTLDIFHNV